MKKVVFCPTAVAMAFLKSRFLFRLALAEKGMRTSDWEASTVWEERKGDGEAGGGMVELVVDLGGELEEERVTEEEEGLVVEARSLRAAFFFLRRTFRS